MADYKKYAENLVGNWEKDIYAPQSKVTQDIYQTNWNKLANDYNDLKDKLAKNFENARLGYSNALNAIQDNSFNRMNTANIDLANRGLSSSGMLDRITQADTQAKGQAVDKALGDLLGTNEAAIEGLSQGVSKYAQKQTGLAGDLAQDLGKLTAADAGNNQAYGNLLAGIGESAAKRAANRAASGGSMSLARYQKKAQDDLDYYYRKMAIYETLNDANLSDDDKLKTLVNELQVPAGDAKSAISSTNYTNTMKKIQERQSELDDINTYANKVNNFLGIDTNNKTNKLIADNILMNLPLLSPDPYTRAIASIFGSTRPSNILNFTKQKQIDTLNKKLNDYTYTDLYDLIYK
jgi:hypothetical protein